MSEERISQALGEIRSAQNALARAIDALPLRDPQVGELREEAERLDHLRSRIEQRRKPAAKQGGLL